MNEPLPISTLKSIIFGDNDEPTEDLDAMPDPMQDFIHRNQVAAALKSSSGASVVLDLPLPPNDEMDCEENSPYYKLPQVVRHDESVR